MTLADRVAVFMDGRIVQVATPRDIFSRPAQVSVAGFIVKQPMNLVPATWRGDTAVELTPRQFSMLEFLLSRSGEVVSKATILSHVWDFSYDGDPNIVEVYVRQLRQRIDVPFGRSSLQTVRLVGYRLDPDGG